jgi:DNA polymerase I-like protein with 3'-5' exonuclease and polymerase domains
VPDFRKEVRAVHSPDVAAMWLDGITIGNIAFDFETTSLKPEGPDSEIVCCGVSWHHKNKSETFAFPWHGKAVRAMKQLLANPKVGKVGWNAKFESRWCGRNGIKVRGWKWDGMLAAHALYNGGKGRAVTGLEFQAYVHLGQGDFKDSMKPYLEASGGYAKNRVKEVDLRSLLVYCGMDALLEYKVSAIQKREMGREEED